MKTRSFLTLAVLSVVLLAPAGCLIDSEARQRSEVQKGIRDATQRFEFARMAPPEEADRELTAVLNDLRSLSANASPDQRQSIALLQTTINRHQADGLLAEIERIEGSHRRLRDTIINYADAAIRLDSIARFQQQIDLPQARQSLNQQSQLVTAERRQMTEKMSQLEGPMSRLRSQNEQDADAAAAIREREEQNIRRSFDLSPADGFPYFSQAIEYRQQADRLEIQIARRELELDDYSRDFEVARLTADNHQRLLRTIESTSSELDSYVMLLRNHGREASQVIDQMRSDIQNLLREIESDAAGPLADLYDRADQRLSEAVTQIGQAGPGEHARSMQPRLAEMRARLEELRATSLMHHEQVLQRLLDAGDRLGTASALRGQLESARASRESHTSRAIEFYEQAINGYQAIEHVAPRGAVERIVTSIQMSISVLEGEDVSVTFTDPGMPAMPGFGPGAAAPPVQLGTGADSPEALVRGLQESMERIDTGYDFLRNHIDVRDFPPAMGVVMDIADRFAGALSRLVTAVEDQFGPDAISELLASAADSPAMGMGDFGLGDEGIDLDDLSYVLDSIRIEEVEGNFGLLTMSIPGQIERETIPIVAIDGRWYISLPPEMVAEMQDEMSGPEAEMGLMMMEGFASQIIMMIDNYASRVSAGEFASLDALAEDIMESVFEMFGGLLGDFEMEIEMDFDMDGFDFDPDNLPPGFPPDFPDK